MRAFALSTIFTLVFSRLEEYVNHTNVFFFTSLDDRLCHNRYGAHIYTQCLRFIPAIVRKWWNGSNQRQSSLVEKITTNFVSTHLCQDEFSALIQRKDKSDNMNIKVAATSRQVTAVYSIDEAKLELIITLPINYPLGAVKVESGKAIGGRLQSRQIVMQCTIFLTHQVGLFCNTTLKSHSIVINIFFRTDQFSMVFPCGNETWTENSRG